MNSTWGKRLIALSALGVIVAVALIVIVVRSDRHHSGAKDDHGRNAAADVPATSSAGCASATNAAKPPAGVSHATFTSSGMQRTYRLFIPPQAAGTTPGAGKPLPLVVDIHGYSEGADVHAMFTGWEAKAAQVGAVVVSPQGQGSVQFWNIGLSGKGIDDTVTIGDLLDHVERTACVDTNRVFVDGFSNGAMLTSVLACRLSDRVAAFGPVSGIFDPPGCHPKRAVPIIAFHGTADPFLSYTGGVGPASASLPITPESADALSGFNPGPVPASVAAWAHRDGCAAKPSVTRVAASVTKTAYKSCRDGADVVLYTEEGTGHTWPGSKAMDAIVSVTGPVNHDISADDLLWSFFMAHPLRK